MNNCIQFFLFLCMTIIISCSDFSTSFEEIEEDRVRTIDFIYRNLTDTTICEAAPGDSVEVTAIFTGEEVRNILLSASFDVRTSLYGSIESHHAQPLNHIVHYSTLKDTGKTSADTIRFVFKVPDDILVASSYLPEHNWISELPEALRSSIPAELAAKSKSDVVELLKIISDTSLTRNNDSLLKHYNSLFPQGSEILLQLFSAQTELTALINTTYTVVSYLTVRFHHRFNRIDSSIIVNRNPTITRMGIYRVYSNNLTFFNPSIHSQSYETILLYDAAEPIHQTDFTLNIVKDESYFLFVQCDSAQMTHTITGGPIAESRRFEWFYHQHAAEALEKNSLMSITNSADAAIVPLIPATTEFVYQCDIWVQVREEATGQRLYPTGSTVFGTKIYFTYTSEYLNK